MYFKVRELEALQKQSDRKMFDLQAQINKMDEIVAKRDETIKEYEDKVRELAFQNAELLETIENKDNEIMQNEVIFPNVVVIFLKTLQESWSAARNRDDRSLVLILNIVNGYYSISIEIYIFFLNSWA